MPDAPVVDLDNLDSGGSYLRYHAARDENFPQYARHRAEVRALCALKAGMAVIEVGCGTGAHLPHLVRLVRPGGAVVAVDRSANMLAAAQQRLDGDQVSSGEARSAVELVQSRLEELSSGARFDVVLADRLIGHLPDPEDGLSQLRALARPGGRVVVVNMLNAATTVNLGAEPEYRELARRVLAWRSERGTTSAWAAVALPSLAMRVGLEPAGAQLWSFACRSLADTYPHTPLMEYGRHALADGAISYEDAATWERLLARRDTDGTFAVGIVIRADVLVKTVD